MTWASLAPDALPWSGTRFGAGLLLCGWVALCVIFSGRELTFLSSLDAKGRRIGVLQHMLMNLAVAAILLPCIVSRSPSLPVFYTVGAGFALLWLAGGWSLVSRYSYTSRLLKEHQANMLNLGRDAADPPALDAKGDHHAD